MKEERQKQIVTLLREHNALSLQELAEACGVSTETVRRDLTALDEAGYVSRVHGGAVIRGGLMPMLNLSERLHSQRQEKWELSVCACDFVLENDVIFIDSGSTAAAFAEQLKVRFEHLTVITHSLDVFSILQDTKFRLILCGGMLKREENAFVGATTLEVIESFHVQKAFLCPTALSIEFGLCDLYDDLIVIQRAMLKHAESVFVLADSTKLEKQAVLCIGKAKSEYQYISDSGVPVTLRALYKENGLMLHCYEALEGKRL